jgi:hypothetical protein
MNSLPEHISYSSLSTYQECGWKYYLTKVEKHTEGHAVWFTGGSAVHKATEVYDLEGGDLETIWNNVWFQQVKEDEEANGDMKDWQFAKREDMSWWYGEGIWMLERWIKFRNSGWSVYKDFVEKEFIERKLKSNLWNITKTAEEIGIQRSHLYNKIDKYGFTR